MTHISQKHLSTDALLIPIIQMKKRRHSTLSKVHNYQAVLGYQPSSLLESKLSSKQLDTKKELMGEVDTSVG